MTIPYAAGEQVPAGEYNEVAKAAGIYAADSAANDSYAITVLPVPLTYLIGMEYTFKANTSNTGACSLNVNGLGAKAIKKNVSQDLDDNDIIAGQMVRVKYDGTNFQLMTNRAQTKIKIGANTATALDYASNTSTTITHNLGVIPKIVRVVATRNAPGGNNRESLSVGVATINTVTGAVEAQQVSVSTDTGPHASFGGIVGIGASGAYMGGSLSGVTSTQFTITFGGTGYGTLTPGGTLTYQWEVVE